MDVRLGVPPFVLQTQMSYRLNKQQSYKFVAFYLQEVDVTSNTVPTEVAMILLCIVTALCNFLHEASSFAPN